MLILFFVLSGLVFGGGMLIFRKYKDDYSTMKDFWGFLMAIVGGIAFVVMMSFCIATMYDIASLSVIDEKISMYKDENENIESQLDTLVNNYMEYESDTYSNLKVDTTENVIALISLYPELKSDELVSKQCDTYVENNNKIKELKETKINGSVYRWMLYFGK